MTIRKTLMILKRIFELKINIMVTLKKNIDKDNIKNIPDQKISK